MSPEIKLSRAEQSTISGQAREVFNEQTSTQSIGELTPPDGIKYFKYKIERKNQSACYMT